MLVVVLHIYTMDYYHHQTVDQLNNEKNKNKTKKTEGKHNKIITTTTKPTPQND